jgi:hypothetical protein
MKRFDITDSFQARAECVVSGQMLAGTIDHIVRNAVGGSTATPIAYYFVWHPGPVDGVREHWRVDCFV